MFLFLRARLMAVAVLGASEFSLGVAYSKQAEPSPWDRKQYPQLGTNMREDREGRDLA